MEFIIKFLALTAVVSGVIIFFLHRVFVESTEGAISKLNDEIAKSNAKQAELSKKLKEADEELEKRKIESKELAEKIRTEAEEESKASRESIVSKAREEGEEIIAKAQNAKEEMRKEIQSEFDIKLIGYSMEILNQVFSQKVKDGLNDVLMDEFLEKLQDIDMSRIDGGMSPLDSFCSRRFCSPLFGFSRLVPGFVEVLKVFLLCYEF